MHGDAAALIHPRERAVRLQREVLLATDVHLAVQPQRTLIQRRQIAGPERERVSQVASGFNRLPDAEDCRRGS